jgi:FtsP/CotA-like multicopper oxidase with cupredoxin domain
VGAAAHCQYGGDGRVTLLGAPFSVVALDGHDLHGPTPLVAVPLPVGEGQHYDIRFRMPESGAVALVTANSDGQYQATPAVVVGPNGEGRVPTPSRPPQHPCSILPATAARRRM